MCFTWTRCPHTRNSSSQSATKSVVDTIDDRRQDGVGGVRLSPLTMASVMGKILASHVRAHYSPGKTDYMEYGRIRQMNPTFVRYDFGQSYYHVTTSRSQWWCFAAALVQEIRQRISRTCMRIQQLTT